MMALLYGSGLNKTQRRMIKKEMYAKIPVIKGEATHEMKIKMHVFQFMELKPLAAKENPTIAPTIVWVVETGMER